jgi:glycosyltransferase involved in cell wall biosynthesis
MNKKHTPPSNTITSHLYGEMFIPSLTHFIQKSKPILIVFSHLRWEFVTQRPQHLMNRLSNHYQIYFIEEPIAYTSKNYGTAKKMQVNKNITVLQPHLEAFDPILVKEIIYDHISWDTNQPPILWFYSPNFVEMVNEINHSLIIFDCMDELSAFKFAPQKLKDQEKTLLKLADIVFTGGRSLYESKKKFHDNVFCFPSSVDATHFKKAHSKSENTPRDLQHITQPIVGYYGVIDERIDIALLGYLSKKHPQLAWVMIGPVVKINPDSLPQAKNLHYLGGKDYEELPTYLSHFDVAMMPFAYNRSTKFISPTKTLEYMAAYKPIISTAITDVARQYPKEVYVAQSYDDFAKATLTALQETKAQKMARIELQKKVLSQTSWDKTAQKMHQIISQSLNQRYSDQRLVSNTQQSLSQLSYLKAE